MVRLSILTIAILTMTASCAGPVQTRIQTPMASPLLDQKQYSFTQKSEQKSDAYHAARKLVAQVLQFVVAGPAEKRRVAGRDQARRADRIENVTGDPGRHEGVPAAFRRRLLFGAA